MLLEDVPGVAKTMLARALAKSVGCTFKRVQCTPDLLPTDITGASIFNQKAAEFEFRAGPIFAQIVLADEINRATPRTQAALLEAMAEGRSRSMARRTGWPRLLRDCHAKSRRPRRDVSAARGAVGSLPGATVAGLSQRGRGIADARTAAARPSDR